MKADRPAATAGLVHDGQARCPVRVEFAVRCLKGFVHAATCGRRTHDFFDWDFRCAPVIGSHAMTHVALGHNAHQVAALFVLNNGCTTASRLPHRSRGVLRGISRRAARVHINGFHLVATTTHRFFLLSQAFSLSLSFESA
jgi:hypothetical protein